MYGPAKSSYAMWLSFVWLGPTCGPNSGVLIPANYLYSMAQYNLTFISSLFPFFSCLFSIGGPSGVALNLANYTLMLLKLKSHHQSTAYLGYCAPLGLKHSLFLFKAD